MKSVTISIFLLALAVRTGKAGVIGDLHQQNAEQYQLDKQQLQQQAQQNFDQEKQETYDNADQANYDSNDIGSHEAQIEENNTGENQEEGHYGANVGQDYGGNQGWQGFTAGSGHDAGAEQSHAALESLGNLGDLISHGINVGGKEGAYDFGDHGNQEHIDLQPKVEVQHDHIPTHTIEKTQPVPVNVVKKIGVPVPHPVGVPTPQIIKVPVPQPYAVHVPVPHPIHVPIYKLVPQEIEKRVPITVEKLVPVYVEKPVKIEVEKHHIEYVEKPYPVHVPVYKHILHSSGHKKW